MQYEFPKISHFDDVHQMISNRGDFFVSQKDGYKIVNYRVNSAETFPDIVGKDLPDDEKHIFSILRECRGIKFSNSGEIICRPLHKFFNCGEKEECFLKNIDLTQPHDVLTKLDGSFISPFFVNERLIWGTKMGETFLSPMVQAWVDDNKPYYDLSVELISKGFTPTFEFTTPQNRIVVDYKTEQLTLIAIRHMVSGSYVPYVEMVKIGDQYGVSVVEKKFSKIDDLEQFIQNNEFIVGEEGYVVRFHSGYMLKIKFKDYVLKHKTKDEITMEKNILQLVLSHTIDDFLPILSEEDRQKVEKYRGSLISGVLSYSNYLKDKFDNYKTAHGDDKRSFGLDVQKEQQYFQSFMFEMNKGSDPYDLIVSRLMKNCTTQSRVDEWRTIVGWEDWRTIYRFFGDD